ncbi:conserved membrane protein of unknown function (plasmid) [Streptomyces ambofaciens ATCC 23877]|uniref:Uncharacterized protein n=1 Tax=Streptomyces ambofaciens (strain ATCC 23877 / 3486 / DSM 40053 / JCM 4204 / NBRC 12836 / NRRL B-2516) TaxID=278992 RepID=A0A0K2B6M9_STRA7|nr:hypothetical protein [Streptomyces ambofaciens]AKZ60717.1 conserved membrane protein of unknown function [Streptomyces ambofaciens ATCC 23877]
MNATTAKTSPLIKLAALLSFGSLIWTTWSLFDLLGAGPAGITVAACADAVWGSVIYAEYRGVRIAGKRWPVACFGWAALLAVASFLVWHGIADNNLAMAYAGPFLPLGAKVVWALALADMRDPAALTDEEKATLAEMERGLVFEEAQHAAEMRRRTMRAELLMAEVSTDFDIEVTRQDRARELQRRRPLELTAAPASLDRTDAVDEVPDERHDAPESRVALAPAETPRIIGEAPLLRDSEALPLQGLSKAAAVRVVRDADPTASAPQIVKRLAHHGIEADAAYVRTVLSRIKARNTTDGGYL